MAPPIERLDLEGLPVYRTDAGPPFVVALLFRVGRSDETLATGGITHLVEHLVFPNEDPIGIDSAGEVSGTETIVFVGGSEQIAVDFMRRIAENCASPPLERVEIERQILQAEAAGRPYGSGQALRAPRFGTVGHGQGSYEEYGLRSLDAAAVEQWAHERFGRANAAACLTGPLPDDFDIPLRSGGTRVPPPEPTPIRGLQLPAYYEAGPPGELAVSFVGQRSAALRTAADVFEHRLRQRLRYELGFSYAVISDYEVLTAKQAQFGAVVDFLNPNADRARDELLTIADEVCSNGATEEELQRQLDGLRWHRESPAHQTGRLMHHAASELLGDTVPADEYDSEYAALTPGAVAAAFAAVYPSLLLVVLPDLSPPPRELVPYPLAPTVNVEGRSFRPRGVRLGRAARRTNYVAGNAGVALVSPGSPGTAVLFSECTAALRWPDGSRGLWSADGFYVEVTPAEIVRGAELVELLDERVPPEVVVRMEPEEEDRLAATTAVIDSKVKRGWVNRQELAALASMLAPGEELRTLANASLRWNLGILAVTDRRLLFLCFDDVKLELRAEDIVDVSARSDAIEVTTPDAVHRLTDIAPKGRPEELADEIRTLSARRPEESA